MASPTCTVNGNATTNGVDVTASSLVTIALASTAGVSTWSLRCVGTDETQDAATITAGLSINNVTKTATYTHPGAGTALIFESKVNGGINPATGAVDANLTTTFKVSSLAAGGGRVLALNETTENDALFGHLPIVNRLIRNGGTVLVLAVDAASSPIAVGDAVCVTTTGTATRAVEAALLVSGAVLGVALTAGSVGQLVTLQMDGLLSPSISGLSSFGPVRVNTTTARLEVVANFSDTDYPVGFSTSTGWVTMVRGLALGGASSGSFSPDSISGLQLWLDPSDAASVTLDTGAVSQLDDKSGNARHFTQATSGNRPTISTLNSINCLNHVQGSQQFLNGPSLSGLTAAEAFIITQNTAALTSKGLWHFGSPADSGFYKFQSDGQIYDSFGSTTRKAMGTPVLGALSLEQTRCFGVISTSAELTAYLDSTQQFTTATNTVGWEASTTRIGRNGTTGTVYYDGKIGEVLIWNRKLTTQERDDVRAYLGAKWGVTF